MILKKTNFRTTRFTTNFKKYIYTLANKQNNNLNQHKYQSNCATYTKQRNIKTNLEPHPGIKLVKN